MFEVMIKYLDSKKYKHLYILYMYFNIPFSIPYKPLIESFYLIYDLLFIF